MSPSRAMLQGPIKIVAAPILANKNVSFQLCPSALLREARRQKTSAQALERGVVRPELDVIEQCHEAEVHVQLLVAMEQGQTGIVRHKVNFHLLVTAEHDDILHDPGCGFSSYPGQFEA